MRKLAATLTASVLALTVAACNTGRPALTFTPDKLPDAITGQSYSAVLTVTGNETPVGDMYVSDGAPPAGVTLDFTRGDTTGTLHGTPAAAGTYVFKVSAWCLGTNVSGQTGEQGYTLVVR